MVAQQTQNICITFIQRWTSVEDAGPALDKCYTNAMCLLCRLQNFTMKTCNTLAVVPSIDGVGNTFRQVYHHIN